jgi:hypothetical protein
MDEQNATPSTESAQVEATETAKKKGGTKAKGKTAPNPKKAKNWKKDVKLIEKLKRDWPLGSLVKYTGSRVEATEGKSGLVIGYRDANGLMVDFGKAGKGSISLPKAELIRKGPAKKEAASA